MRKTNMLLCFSIELLHVHGVRHRLRVIQFRDSEIRRRVSGHSNFLKVMWRSFELVLEWGT